MPISLSKFVTNFLIVQKKIKVIIGGPGTGKTSIIDELKARGYCCYPEISREVTMEAKKQGIDQLFLEQPHLQIGLVVLGLSMWETNNLH